MFITITVIFLIALFVLILNSSSQSNRNMLLDPTPDLTNCANFVDTFAIHTTCSPDQRYDTVTRQCRNYYLVDCGVRPNPPYPSADKLCEPYSIGMIIGQRTYPLNNAEYFANCSNKVKSSAELIESCGPNLVYDIDTQQCVESTVIGSRCTGENCPVESK
ncbi:ORF79 [Betabaculovirus altermyunipunctae]|uniref:ORF79 n=1 Tax=Betabaculovirus altermyunipunctae TaxID=3051996 RepID=A0A1S5YE65_9BBAC|nr:ORF79 [Betabaculovirus altermyunipunctae]AQQ80346.1 ORF79 [Betabaculovirus altermyunipunctae]